MLQNGERRMEIEDIRTFVEVADAGGVTPAAQRLGISKSMVSRRIARLEAELGAQLLSRTTRGIALTEEGATFRDYAARISAEIDAARETILPAGELRGRLRVAAPLSFGPTHFAPVLAQMARRHPQLHVYSCYTDRFVDLITEGFDCAIRVGYLPDSNLVARRVGPLYGKFVASPAYVAANGAPETPDELLNHQALMQGTEVWQVADGDQVLNIRPQGRFKADNGVALLAAALEGIGIARLPDGLTDQHIATGTLVEVMTRYPPPTAGIFVVRPPAQHPSRKVRVLTEMLIECFDSGS
ncbi:LysR family transcriptional regulator protein [Rhizobium phaseoli]|nr:LysR family transcriptional regulator protein [Rhizobium phaseoli]ANL65489.1 LysR family transcriptional regulator protein [Rhizobium phaseoli]ANL71798.1 LysR family transcriptional regulator protein [Rhizobium phaseoli]ANL78302.1 LysR family transcriptional regulator protein [Rhizobium phaseoli]ANL97611.1 LysR family transcriptional regulator protein [Rhizobium phaseoli]